MPSEARQKKIMEKLNRAQKCSILGPQNLGSGGGPGPRGPPWIRTCYWQQTESQVMLITHRYEAYWLELMKRYPDRGRRKEMSPPLDVYWIWHVHMLRWPVLDSTYLKFCISLRVIKEILYLRKWFRAFLLNLWCGLKHTSQYEG